uniref:Transmembrane protein n=1 Tax=Panagrellus redivivus TaxID=6233 RepID=A0A7E4VRD1_PANRE
MIGDQIIISFILGLYVWNDIVQAPVAIGDAPSQTVQAVLGMYPTAICPIVVYPAFGALLDGADHALDKHRKFSFYTHDPSLLLAKARYYMDVVFGNEFNALVELGYAQLTASIPKCCTQSSINLCFNVIAILWSSALLIDPSFLDAQCHRSPRQGHLMCQLATRIIFLYYVIGPVNVYEDSTLHFSLFFLSSVLYVFLYRVLLGCSWRIEENRIIEQTSASKLSDARVACVAFATFATAVTQLALVQSAVLSELSLIYRFFLLMDAIVLALRGFYVLVRLSFAYTTVANAHDVRYQVFLLKMFVMYMTDLLEVCFVAMAICFGVFLRGRLMSVLLVSIARRHLLRILYFSHPTYSTLEQSQQLALQ